MLTLNVPRADPAVWAALEAKIEAFLNSGVTVSFDNCTSTQSSISRPCEHQLPESEKQLRAKLRRYDCDPFQHLAVAREGRTLIEWLDANIVDLEGRQAWLGLCATAGDSESGRRMYLCIEQLRRTLVDIRANL